MYRVKISSHAPDSKVEQIADAIAHDIEQGHWQPEQKLPSINEFSKQNRVARDTIEKAYRLLKEKGYVQSFASRGYFVLGKNGRQKKVLLLFNKLSSFKKIIYENLLRGLGDKAKVDLQVHHYDPRILRRILEETSGRYDYYVIMPHFFSTAKEAEYMDTIKKVPSHQLVLLDKFLPALGHPCRAVYQDFNKDIYYALCGSRARFKRYKALSLVLPEDIHHPREIREGIEQFCKEQGLRFECTGSPGNEALAKYCVYITTDEDSLAKLLIKVKKTKLVPGKDLGIVSFNETLYKELLGITVMTTDFAAMGRTAAKLILDKSCKQIKNPFRVIYRGSF